MKPLLPFCPSLLPALTLAATAPAPVQSASNPYVNLIGSRSFADDRVVMHVNLGAFRERAAAQSLYTWGVGAEVLLVGRLSGIAETCNQQRDSPSTQVGLRYWINPNRLQVDTTLGTQGTGGARRAWASLGLRILW